MNKKNANHEDSSCHKSKLPREWTVQCFQKKGSTLLIKTDIHGDDEGCVEVCENIPVVVDDGRFVLEEEDCEAVRQKYGYKHEGGGKYIQGIHYCKLDQYQFGLKIVKR